MRDRIWKALILFCLVFIVIPAVGKIINVPSIGISSATATPTPTKVEATPVEPQAASPAKIVLRVMIPLLVIDIAAIIILLGIKFNFIGFEIRG